MMVISVQEFLWNLQLILHNRHPFGLRLSKLEAEYSKFSGIDLKPCDVLPGAQDWRSTIENSPAIAKYLKLTSFDSSSTKHNIKSNRNVGRKGSAGPSFRRGGCNIRNNPIKPSSTTVTSSKEDPLVRPICPRDEREFREIWNNANYQNIMNYNKLYGGASLTGPPATVVDVDDNFIEIPQKSKKIVQNDSSSQSNNTLNNNLINVNASTCSSKKRRKTETSCGSPSFLEMLNPQVSIEELPNMLPPVTILPSISSTRDEPCSFSPPPRPSSVSGSNSSSNCTRVLTPRSRTSSNDDQGSPGEILGDPLAFCDDHDDDIKPSIALKDQEEKKSEFMFVALPIPEDPEMFEDEDVTVMEPAEFILDETLVSPAINSNNLQKQQQMPQVSSNSSLPSISTTNAEKQQEQQRDQEFARQSLLYKQLQQQKALENELCKRQKNLVQTRQIMMEKQQENQRQFQQQHQQNITKSQPVSVIQNRQQQSEINQQQKFNWGLSGLAAEDSDTPIIINVVSGAPSDKRPTSTTTVQNNENDQISSSRILTDRPQIKISPYKGVLTKSDLDSILYDPDGTWQAIPSNNFLFPPRIFHKGDKGEGLFWYDPDHNEWKSYENEIMHIVLPNNTVVLGQVVEFIIETPDPKGGDPVNTYKNEFHIFDAGRIGGLDISNYSYAKRHQLTVKYFTSPKMSSVVRTSIKVKMHCTPAEISTVFEKIVWKEIAQHTLPFMWDSHAVYLTLAGFLFINCSENDKKSFYDDSRILWENIEDLNVVTKFTSPSLYHLREILHQKEEVLKKQKQQEELKKQQQIQQQQQQLQYQQQLQQQQQCNNSIPGGPGIPGGKKTSPETISHLTRLIHQRQIQCTTTANQQINPTSVIVPSNSHTISDSYSVSTRSPTGHHIQQPPPAYNSAIGQQNFLRRNSRQNSIEILDNLQSPINYGNLTPRSSNSSPNSIVTYHYGHNSPRSTTPIQQQLQTGPTPIVPMISVSANNQNLFSLPMTNIPNLSAFPSPPNTVCPSPVQQQQQQNHLQKQQQLQQQSPSLPQQKYYQNQNYTGGGPVILNSNLNNLINTYNNISNNLQRLQQQQRVNNPVLYNSLIGNNNDTFLDNNPMLLNLLGNQNLNQNQRYDGFPPR